MVASVNPKGIRLEGRDGWLNFSKFAGDLVPPARGAHVAVTLDGQGFVRALEPADAAIKSGDVLAIAARWEHWVTREEEG